MGLSELISPEKATVADWAEGYDAAQAVNLELFSPEGVKSLVGGRQT